MQISYNEACGRDCSSLELDLRLCEKAGFDYIEIRLDMLKDYLEKHSIKELDDFFRLSHIKPHALNALYLYKELFSPDDDAARRDELMEQFKRGCEVGKAIGCEYFIVVPPLQPDPAGGAYVGTQQETHESCVRILKALAHTARQYDIKLCFELVGFARSSVRTVAEAKAIVSEVDEDNVGYVFDAYNIFLYTGQNDFSEIATVEPHKIFAAHIMSADDVPESERGQDKRSFCGTGVVDTDAFLQALKATGYDGMVSIETFRPEYWSKPPQWVISTAYETTRAAMEKSGCYLNVISPFGRENGISI